MKLTAKLHKKPLAENWTNYYELIQAAGIAKVYFESWPFCVLAVTYYRKESRYGPDKRAT